LLLLLGGCQIGDNLNPSGDDRRPDVTPGTIGYLPGQTAADFSVADSHGDTVTLSQHLAGGATPADAVVLYFTMWCPICLSHSDHLALTVAPQFATRGTVRYFLVDYVSGSVSATHSAEMINGYDGSVFATLADVDQAVYDQFHAAMGTVVVIDANGKILVNEDYRDGSPVMDVLDALLPP
jgi:peroxiredoxin